MAMREKRQRQSGAGWRAVIIGCAFFAALVIGCAATESGSVAIASEEEKIEIVPVELTGLNARAVPAGEYVFNERETWEAFWSKHGREPAPEIDFEQYTLVAVFLGRRPNPGYSVKIVGAEEKLGETIVKVAEYLPDPGMMYAQVIVYPFDAALIPKMNNTITFNTSKKSGRP
jgi:hypothetical protein